MSHEPKTHFGFEQVDWNEKQQKVAEVFSRVADQYDLMNDVMSLGLHRVWKWLTALISQVKPGQQVLDIACGSGDLACLLSERTGPTGKVYLADINAQMLEVGRRRLLDKGILENVCYTQADAQSLPFPDNYFHVITMGFGLRNVTDKPKALQELARVCKPGGKLLVLEFSMPVSPALKSIYDIYSFKVLPKMGQWIAEDDASYRYLAESIRMHPRQNELKEMIEAAGFDACYYHNLAGGIVALHIAYKY